MDGEPSGGTRDTLAFFTGTGFANVKFRLFAVNDFLKM